MKLHGVGVLNTITKKLMHLEAVIASTLVPQLLPTHMQVLLIYKNISVHFRPSLLQQFPQNLSLVSITNSIQDLCPLHLWHSLLIFLLSSLISFPLLSSFLYSGTKDDQVIPLLYISFTHPIILYTTNKWYVCFFSGFTQHDTFQFHPSCINFQGPRVFSTSLMQKNIAMYRYIAKPQSQLH